VRETNKNLNRNCPYSGGHYKEVPSKTSQKPYFFSVHGKYVWIHHKAVQIREWEGI